MKIKQQQQNYSNNLNTTVLFNSSNSTTATTGFNSTMTSNHQTETQANNAEFINSQSVTPTTIWTRSAAFKAAQSHDQSHFISDNVPLVSTTASLNSYKRNSHHFGSNHHGHYQHVLGKIVKPIPVRPISSSSSSSSTHSSLFNQQSSNAFTGVLASLNRNQLNDHSLNANDVEIDSNNFSLIAKYFASFPATRLKSTSSSSTSNNQASLTDNFHHCTRHHHCSKSPTDLFQNRNHETPTPTLPSAQLLNQNKLKTFMPFKKQNQTTKSHVYITSPASNSFQDLIPTDKIQSTFILRSQSALSNTKSSTINNTDHLCTNFKRMIKLSDNQVSHANESDPASPLTAASNTPTFDNSNIDLSAYNNNNAIETHANTFTFPNFDCDFVLPVNYTSDNSLFNLQSGAATSSDQSTRFGQITMETRSTRKFLIKHHPYLQLNSNINNNSTNTNKLFNQQRPSINLIKMKKLCSKSKMNESSETINTRQSGRLSRINDQDESKLLKFTDTAPQINLNQLNQSNYSLRVKNSNCKNNSTKNTKTNKTNIKKTNPIQNPSHQTTNLTLNQEEWCCCQNGDLEHDEYDINNCFEDYDDGQEEDSSGYYSSYHSVDLVSSSGGGSIIGDNKQDLKQENKTTNLQQVPAPQHHYNTRSNFLQQTNSNCSPNRTITATPSSLNNSISNKNNNTTPTTRLRYQQQLAAAAVSAAATTKTSPNNMKLSTAYFTAQQANNNRFHEQYQLECDLDLDQIEND